jgi:predicted CopG family antitoxin
MLLIDGPLKTLNIPLEDQEYAKLTKVKGDKTWRDFIMELLKK